MPPYPSDRVTKGKSAAAARSLWMAAGVGPADFGKPWAMTGCSTPCPAAI